VRNIEEQARGEGGRGMPETSSGETKPAWVPRSWRSGEIEELDVDPRELAQRIREHEGEDLIDLDAVRHPPAGA
jgi:hypothetical protein